MCTDRTVTSDWVTNKDEPWQSRQEADNGQNDRCLWKHYLPLRSVKSKVCLSDWKCTWYLRETDTKSVQGHLIYPEAYTKLYSKVLEPATHTLPGPHVPEVCSFCWNFAKLCGTPGFWENWFESISCFYIEIAYSKFSFCGTYTLNFLACPKISTKRAHLLSKNVQNKHVNRIIIENQQYTCTTKVNY